VARPSHSLLGLSLLAAACAAPPPAPSPPPPPRAPSASREPRSPLGTEGLRAHPCSSSVDLSHNAVDLLAFSPASRSLTGRTALSATLLRPGDAFLWSTSRPASVHIEGDSPDAITLLVGAPGTTLLTLAATSAEPGREADPGRASVILSVPMFVRVRGDAAFDEILDQVFGLADRKASVIAAAREAIDAIYERVNLRVAWEVGLGEGLPASLQRGGFAAGRFIAATLHGRLESCATPQSSFINTEFGGYGEGDSGERLVTAPVHICPAIFARHPDAMAWMVQRRATLFPDERGEALYATILGRAIGELLAHEVGHQLLGCDQSLDARALRCHDRTPESLMNKAGERSFSARTGIVLAPGQYAAWRDDFPRPGTYEDHGARAINRLPPEAQAVLDRILPVPPALSAMIPCAPAVLE
jgi:hypothetical protein